MKQTDLLYKIVLSGPSACGKSSLYTRYSTDPELFQWDGDFVSTIGTNFVLKTIVVNGQQVKLQIWDTAGQERFRSITSSYYRGANVILLVFDITKRKTFEALPKWLSDINPYRLATENAPKVILVANKLDLVEESEQIRAVSRQEAEMFAKEHDMTYFETSAKYGTNVQKTFEDIIYSMDTHSSGFEKEFTYHDIIYIDKPRKKAKCC